MGGLEVIVTEVSVGAVSPVDDSLKVGNGLLRLRITYKYVYNPR